MSNYNALGRGSMIKARVITLALVCLMLGIVTNQLPAPVDAGGQRLSRDVFHTLHHRHQLFAPLRNDGSETDTLWVQGPGSRKNWTVQYLNQRGQDVTARVTRVQGWKRQLGPGQVYKFSIQVTPQSWLAAGKKRRVLVVAKSGNDPSKGDAIKMVTRVQEE